MLRKIGTGAFAAASLFLVLAGQPGAAFGDQATPAGKAHAMCRLKCNEAFMEYANTCSTGKACAEKCAGSKSKGEACQACVAQCLEPKKKEVITCMEKCPPPS